ncbi:MAG: PilZ domain-containing protein [Planctomycetota bacterium]|nr:MAG: PilZ domain-containing protein [Planctomycetota bacterium]
MNGAEKRKFKRIPLTLDLSCRIVGSVGEPLHTGRTVNVSPCGLYFRTEAGIFEPGNLVKIDLSMPPTVGLLESGGRISGLARVLRTRSVPDSSLGFDLHAGGFGVALEFCQPLKLCT